MTLDKNLQSPWNVEMPSEKDQHLRGQVVIYSVERYNKSTSPQLPRSQDLDQLSRLRTSGNDQQYKSFLAQLRRNQNFTNLSNS